MPARRVTGTGANLLVLQHIACEPPGAYEDELLDHGGELCRVMVDRGEPLPDWRAFDGIIAMGGPMGAYEDDRLPWLRDEKRLIADGRLRGNAVLGRVPRGAAAGSEPRRARRPRAEPRSGRAHGVPDRRRRGAIPCSRVLPEEFVALQWHADTFALPDGGVRLARSDAYEQQAFVVNRAYGVQFHIEVGSELAAEWGEVPAYAESLEALMGEGALSRLLDQIAAAEDEMTSLARRLFAAWLERVVGAPARH